MRKLNVDDVFNAAQLVDIFDIPKLYDRLKGASRKNPEDFAKQAMVIMIQDAGTAENRQRIYEFLAGPFEMPAGEVSTMPFVDFCKGIMEIGQVSEWESFLKSVSGTE